jgi:hypothetical protein
MDPFLRRMELPELEPSSADAHVIRTYPEDYAPSDTGSAGEAQYEVQLPAFTATKHQTPSPSSPALKRNENTWSRSMWGDSPRQRSRRSLEASESMSTSGPRASRRTIGLSSPLRKKSQLDNSRGPFATPQGKSG